MRKFWIQIFLLPNLRSAVAYLKHLDANDTGADDEAAAALALAIERIEKALAAKEQQS